MCFGNEQLPYKQQMCAFRRVSHIMDHVENSHLSKLLVDQMMICHHPVCKAEGLVLKSVMHFKNHVASL